jgi:RNA recognition motif-containing protein
LRDHFTKAGVVPGRIHFPLTKETNLPRGFAYVDLPDNDQYIVILHSVFNLKSNVSKIHLALQKGFKLHNTFIGKRHIRVEFTMPGKKKAPNRMKAIKSKDLKLKAMQRRGILLPKVKPTLSEIVAKSEA